MLKEIALTALYVVLFNYVIYRFKKLQLTGFKPIITNLLFNLKFLTGIFIWVVYTFYYKDTANNDVHKFYNDAVQLNELAFKNPKAFVELMFIDGNKYPNYTGQIEMQHWYRNFDEAPINENRTIIRINALLMFLSLKTYFVHILMMCFLSLAGWVLAFNAIFIYAKKQPSLLALATLLLPSVLFWTSGVLKEPILVLGLGVFCCGLLVTRYRVKEILLLAIGALILLSIKFYVLVCLLPAVLAFGLLPSNTSPKFIAAKYGVVMLLLLMLAFNIQHVVGRINAMQMLANKQMHSVKEAKYFNAGSRIDIPEIEANAVSIITTVPVGIWNTVTRPYLWEGKNPMMLASAIENLLVLAILILAAWFFNKQNLQLLNLILLLLAFSIAYFALIGICTPVLGNLVRYKAPILPFFLLAMVLLTDNEGFVARFPIFKKLQNSISTQP